MRARKNKKKMPPLIWRLLKRYLRNSGIHGVRYLVEEDRHWTERVFWLVACGLSWIGCATMISGSVEQFKHHRVAVTVETNYLDWIVEVPSVHICSSNTPEATNYMTTVWNRKGSSARLLGLRTLGYQADLPEPHDRETFANFSETLALKCEEIFLSCNWRGKDIDCCEGFRPLRTPIGDCLSLNSIYTKSSAGSESIFLNTTSKESGANVLRLEFKQTKLLNTVAKTGGVYVLGNLEMPSLTTSSEKKLTGYWKTSTMHVDVTQQPTYNEDGIGDIPVEKRNCRFSDENENLRAYPAYGYEACVIEEQIRFMYDLCGCVSHIFPRSTSMPVCNHTELKCIANSASEFFAMKIPNCLADCDETIYNIFQNGQANEAKKPIVILNLLPGPSLRYLRYVVHSKLDLVVAVGSALGLFVGASILSLVEIPYWFIVRGINDNDENDN